MAKTKIREEINNFLKGKTERNNRRNRIYKWIILIIPKGIKRNIIYLRNQYIFKKIMEQYNKNDYSTITSIGIEFASYCNLRCKWCSLDHNKKKEILTKEILEKLLKDLVYDKRFKLVKDLNLWNGGEILLNQNLIELLKLLKKYKKIGIKKNKFFPRVNMKTNGMLLTKDISSKIIKLNIIDNMSFSMDGGTKEEYESIRKYAKLKTLIKNIKDFRKISKNKILMEISCIVNPKRKLNTNWMEKEFQNILNNADSVVLIHPMDWDGSVDLNLEKDNKIVKGCLYLMRQLILLPNGDVTVCCRDLNSRGVIGNILKNSLFEIYNCNKRRVMIELNLSGNRHKILLCKNCSAS